MLTRIETYFSHPNRDYQGNPLIEAFPYISREKMARILFSPIETRPEELGHEAELRLQYVKRLSGYFVPHDRQTDFALSLWNTVMYGYAGRNPATASAAEQFNELLRFVTDGEAKALGLGTIFGAPSCVTLYGTPGTGKSRTLKGIFKRFDGVFFHPRTSTYQILCVHVSAPGRGRDTKTLPRTFFNILRDRAIAVGLRVPSLGMNASLGALCDACLDIARLLNLGVLVVDELQHLMRGTEGFDQETMKFLTDLINKLEITIVLVGTWKIVGLLSSELRLSRRALSEGSTTSRKMANDEEFWGFLKGLFVPQFTTKRVSLNQGFNDIFYKHTQGIEDLTIKLMQLSQVEAIRSGVEELSPTLVDEVADEHFGIVAPAIRMMREGYKETDPILWDIEPANFDEYLGAITAKSELEMASGRRFHTIGQQKVVRERIRKALVSSELASEETASTIAEHAIQNKSNATVGEHLKEVFTATLPRGPRPTRSEKRLAETDHKFDKLDDTDVRKVIYLASRTKRDFSEALTEAGYYGPLTDDVSL